MKKVNIYTDGACSKNPGPGGWAAILEFNGIEKEISGYCEETTNNRMELTAAIQALKILKEKCVVELYSDSAYLINAFSNGWIYAWQRNGWKTSSKQPVENQDLWKLLINLGKEHKINYHKVKGHADHPYNNRCDQMARQQIKKNSAGNSSIVFNEFNEA